MEKKEIRKLIFEKRKKLKKNIINKNSDLINKKIIHKFNLINKKIGIYFPINNEVVVNNFLFLENIRLFFPKIEINSKFRKIYFSEINHKFFKNHLNVFNYKQFPNLIFQHKTIQPKFKKNILIPEIILVPLIAFNKECFRIGYGWGLYDKYLKNKKTLKIGLAMEFQKLEFNSENHDIALDYIFTEKRIYKKPCKNIFQTS